MKIGTDGVLLGAWTSVDTYPNTILDIGTGTGIIALMLAQRSDATTVDALEIEEAAYEQAVENFEQSHWGDRLFCYHASFQDFTEEMVEEEETYDLIVSNPPFYEEDYKTADLARNQARFTTSLSFQSLLEDVSKLLSENGVFSVIIPFKEESSFIKLANKNKLFLNRVCHVKGNPEVAVKRGLLAFSFQETTLLKEELTIEIARHQYTKKYIDLTKDFYLKM